MRRQPLGRTGMAVSVLGLGTMTWGRDTDEYEAAKQLELFFSAGGTVIDTASTFAGGASEEMLGSLLPGFADAGAALMVKCGGVASSERPFNNSRAFLRPALDSSLRRLGVERVDVWLMHGFDEYTPVHETLDTLAWAVQTDRAAYVGVCNWPDAWVGHAHSYLGARHNLELACVQADYSLVNRKVERSLLPYLAQAGSSLVCLSPLGRGVLTGKYRYGTPSDSRAASTHLRSFVEPYLGKPSTVIVEAVCAAAEGLGRSPVDVALGWLRSRAAVATALLGARTAAQLRGILDNEHEDLPAAIVRALDDVSTHAMNEHEQDSA